MNLSRHGLDESRIPAYMHKNRCIHTSRIRMHLQLQINIRRMRINRLNTDRQQFGNILSAYLSAISLAISASCSVNGP